MAKKGKKQVRAKVGRLYAAQPPRVARGVKVYSSHEIREKMRGKSSTEQAEIMDYFLSQIRPTERDAFAEHLEGLQAEVSSFADLVKEGLRLEDSGDLREAANKYWEAFQVASDLGNSRRYVLLAYFTDMMRSHSDMVTKQDRKKLKKVFRDDQEAALNRIEAGHALGVMAGGGKGAVSATACQEVREIWREALTIRATPEELAQKIFFGRDHLVLYEEIFEQCRDHIRTSLETDISFFLSKEKYEHSKEVVHEDEDPELFRRMTEIAGEKCDYCHVGAQYLGIGKLACCSLCRLAFYCSRDCQVAAWQSGGHKKACRPADARVSGDLMHVKGLKARKDMNGRLVRLVAQDELTGRWQVCIYTERFPGDDSNKTLSIKAENLVHIRPAK